MERNELTELHYIASIDNVASIIKLGILSNVRVRRIPHVSIAMQEIQDRRSLVMVPGGRKLHEYVNLYICGRNPMLCKRQDQRDQVCVLSVSTEVLDLPGVVVTDGNASGAYARFAKAPAGLQIVNRDLTFADYWTDPDRIQYYRKKSAKCAEVLVPDRVQSDYILAAYVWNEHVSQYLQAIAPEMEVRVNAHLFFA
jgi:hypothetical protein